MQIDALTLAAIADELRTSAMGARVEDVIQPTPESVALQLYAPGRPGWLLVSAHPQLARVHLLASKPRKLTAEPPSFVMLLRKHLEGARIVAIHQPAWERVLELGFARGPAPHAGYPGSAPAVWLVAEVMGRLSNLVLRDEAGMILGALHTVGGEVNRYRAIQPHAAYREPPPQTRALHGLAVPRLAAESVSEDALRAAVLEVLAAQHAPAEPARGGKQGRARARREAPTVAGLLAAHVAGWSRELGREVAARALGAPDAPLDRELPWAAIAAEVRPLAALVRTHAWQPTLVSPPPALPLARGGESDVSTAPALPAGRGGQRARTPDLLAFAVYEPRQYAGAQLVPMPSANIMLATYFEGAEWRAAIEGAKADLRHRLQTQRSRCVRKDHVLHGELAALDEAARLRQEADILLAFQADVPPHASSVTLPNPFAEGGATATLSLDPQLSAVENANRRYRRYHKLQRAAQMLPAQLEANQLELARIAQLVTDLELAETSDEIAHVRREVAEAGYLRQKPDPRLARKPSMQGKLTKGSKAGKGGKPVQPARRAEGGAPLKRVSSDGFALFVGKNSRQNEEVTFHQASGADLWLHARGVPGAHVIVKSGGRPAPETTIRQAAELAAYYSQSREAGSVPVDVTEQRYVRHMKGGGPGMVTYERERTLHVTPSEIAAG